MGSGGLELPPGDEGHEGNSTDVPPGAVSLARPMEMGSIGPELDWGADAWREVRTRAQRAGRAYIWLNLVEQRLRAVVAAVLRPIYEPVHGDDWVVAAADRPDRNGCSARSRYAKSAAARGTCSIRPTTTC